MRHPFRKLIHIELLSLAAAFAIGIAALLTGFLTLLFFSLYLVMISLAAHGLVLLQTRQPAEAGKQFFRCTLLFLFITYLIFRL